MLLKNNYTLLLFLFLLPVGCGDKKSDMATKPQVALAMLVKVEPLKQLSLADRLVVRCALRSRDRAVVAARVPGILAEIRVDEGDKVKAGQTVLFVTEQSNAENRVKVAQADLEVTKRVVEEAEAAALAADAAKDKALLDRDRLRRLHTTGQAVTKDQVEKSEVGYTAATADHKRAKAGIGVARARVTQATRLLAIANKSLADCTVLAPLDGVITAKKMERGELGAVGKPVFEIESQLRLEARAFLETRYFAQVRPGHTKVRLLRANQELVTGRVSWKSPVVRTDLRVFEIRFYLPQAFAKVRSGELLTLELILAERMALAVPTAALLVRGKSQVVFSVEAGKAQLHRVETGIIDGPWTEILGAELSAEQVVVTTGQSFLQPGRSVRTSNGGR